MKSTTPQKPSRHMRRATEKQVREYVDRYYPQWGKVSVKISPDGIIAAVRANSKPKERG